MMASRKDVDVALSVRSLMQRPAGYLPAATYLVALVQIVY